MPDQEKNELFSQLNTLSDDKLESAAKKQILDELKVYFTKNKLSLPDVSEGFLEIAAPKVADCLSVSPNKTSEVVDQLSFSIQDAAKYEDIKVAMDNLEALYLMMAAIYQNVGTTKEILDSHKAFVSELHQKARTCLGKATLLNPKAKGRIAHQLGDAQGKYYKNLEKEEDLDPKKGCIKYSADPESAFQLSKGTAALKAKKAGKMLMSADECEARSKLLEHFSTLSFIKVGSTDNPKTGEISLSRKGLFKKEAGEGKRTDTRLLLDDAIKAVGDLKTENSEYLEGEKVKKVTKVKKVKKSHFSPGGLKGGPPGGF